MSRYSSLPIAITTVLLCACAGGPAPHPKESARAPAAAATVPRPANPTANAVPATPQPAAKAPPAVPPEEATARVSGDARGRFSAALEAIRGERYQEAQKILEPLTRDYPDLAGPYLNLGIVFARLGHTREAEQAFRAAIERRPDSAPAYSQLGVLYREEGRFADARRAYERALEIDSTYAEAHLNLGILFDLYLQQPEAALEHYQRFRDLAGDSQGVVEKWITDLKHRVAGQGSSPGGTGS